MKNSSVIHFWELGGGGEKANHILLNFKIDLSPLSKAKNFTICVKT